MTWTLHIIYIVHYIHIIHFRNTYSVLALQLYKNCQFIAAGKKVDHLFEHFMEILPLKICDAESVYSTQIKWLMKKSMYMYNVKRQLVF